MRSRVIGLAATLGIGLFLVGIPVGLLIAGGSPLPHGLPSWGSITNALSRPDDGTAVLAVLKVVGWLAWLSFAAMVVLEVAGRLRGAQVPRIPMLAIQQRAAAGLVGAAALLFTAAPLISGAATPAQAIEPAALQVTTTNVQTAAMPTHAVRDQTTTAAAKAAPKQRTETYVVQPGDSLWSIAEAKLGDGARFGEIADLNYGAHQADGGSLSASHWIQPGWKLQIPNTSAATTTEPGHLVVKPGDTLSQIAEDTLGDAAKYPQLFDASQDTVQPGAAHLSDPNLIRPGWTITVPGAHTTKQDHGQVDGPASDGAEGQQQNPPVPAPAQQTPTPGTSQGQDGTADIGKGVHQVAQEGDENDGFPVRTAAGVGALLAAGVLSVIAVRRNRQQRRRKPGQRLPMPTGVAADVEQELRATADPLSVETVDRALRSLAARCVDRQQPLPAVRAARLTADQFDLYLAEPATLPAPWEGTADAAVWTLPADVEDLLTAEQLEAVPAPYPSLVTIGHDDEDGHVFLDLEFLGALAITGTPDETRQVLAAIAVELATSRWADDLQVTIVGAYSELEGSLETGRVRYVPVVGRLLEELQHRADTDRDALAQAGAEDLNHARVQGAAPGVWTPEIVLLAGDFTPTQRTQLAELVAGLPRVAIAAVTTGSEPVGEWTIRLTGPQSGTLEPIGLHVRPQQLDDATYAQVLNVLATTDEDDDTSHSWATTEPTLDDLPADDVADDEEEQPPDTHTPVESSPETKPVHPEPPEQEEEPDIESEATAASRTAAVEHEPVDEAFPATTAETPQETNAEDAVQESAAEVKLLPRNAPQLLLMGPVEIINATGAVEPPKKARLTELAAFLATNPGCDHTAIDTAQWPGQRVSDNSRNTSMSKLRRWLGKTAEGDDFLPRYQRGAGYRLHEDVITDWEQWNQLLPDGPESATSAAIGEALRLVRGRPFDAARARRYNWAETLKRTMICAIVDASYELARRGLMEGRWRATEDAALVGLSIEPGYEPLWRARILGAHAAGNLGEEQVAIERLLYIVDQIDGELEPETEELLEQIKTGNAPGRGQLAAGTL